MGERSHVDPSSATATVDPLLIKGSQLKTEGQLVHYSDFNV